MWDVFKIIELWLNTSSWNGNPTLNMHLEHINTRQRQCTKALQWSKNCIYVNYRSISNEMVFSLLFRANLFYFVIFCFEFISQKTFWFPLENWKEKKINSYWNQLNDEQKKTKQKNVQWTLVYFEDSSTMKIHLNRAMLWYEKTMTKKKEMHNTKCLMSPENVCFGVELWIRFFSPSLSSFLSPSLFLSFLFSSLSISHTPSLPLPIEIALFRVK